MRRLAAVLLVCAPIAWADRVVLKSGGSLNGVIVERTTDRVILDVGPGRIGIPMGRVERIEAGVSDLAFYRERAARIAAGDAQAWMTLGLWARDRGLETQARQAFEAALQADPGLEEAHRALGHVRHGELWLTPEENYRARGLVPFEGNWVTPAEREGALRERAESDARAQGAREAEARAREAEARAASAEAEARRAAQPAEDSSGLPYWWIFGGGVCSTPHCGQQPVRPSHPNPPPPHRPPPAPEPPASKTGTMR